MHAHLGTTGSLTKGLEGRAPEHAESSNFQVNRLQGTSSHHNTAESYPDAWVITYVLTWTGGKLREKQHLGCRGKRSSKFSCTSLTDLGSLTCFTSVSRIAEELRPSELTDTFGFNS